MEVLYDRIIDQCVCTRENNWTDAVFHAPMFALKRNAVRNVCEPNLMVHAD